VNWELIGAVAELIGAAGVAISLVYLARQMKLANRLAKAEAWRSRFAELTTLNSAFGVNPRFHHAMVKVYRGALEPDLEPDEVGLVSSYTISVAAITAQLFREVNDGVLDQKALNDFVGQGIFLLPFYRSNWALHRQILDPGFVQYVEKKHGLDSHTTAPLNDSVPPPTHH
jgi:hypothetical protein